MNGLRRNGSSARIVFHRHRSCGRLRFLYWTDCCVRTPVIFALKATHTSVKKQRSKKKFQSLVWASSLECSVSLWRFCAPIRYHHATSPRCFFRNVSQPKQLACLGSTVTSAAGNSTKHLSRENLHPRNLRFTYATLFENEHNFMPQISTLTFPTHVSESQRMPTLSTRQISHE